MKPSRTSRASGSTPSPESGESPRGLVREKTTGGRKVIVAAAIIIVLVVGGYVLTSTPPSPGSVNRLTNGGFETGNLQGWQTVPPYLPTVESSIVEVGSSSHYAARFQTSSNNAEASGPCLIRGVGCGHLNTSTIFQNLINVTVSKDTRFSMAVYPAFQSPSAFQVSLDFVLAPSAKSQTNSTDAIIYYLVIASPQQCSNYSRDLVNRSSARAISAAAYCVSTRQNSWTQVNRELATDLPSGITPSVLRGSILTVSVSFAGAGPTDMMYVDSLSLA